MSFWFIFECLYSLILNAPVFLNTLFAFPSFCISYGRLTFAFTISFGCFYIKIPFWIFPLSHRFEWFFDCMIFLLNDLVWILNFWIGYFSLRFLNELLESFSWMTLSLSYFEWFLNTRKFFEWFVRVTFLNDSLSHILNDS